MKSIKLSKYFEIIKPDYIYLKLIPLKSIRNYNSDKIAKAIASMYKDLLHSFKYYNKKLFFECPSKVGYYIYIEKQEVNFYFIVPQSYYNLLKDKIQDTWHGITITKIDEIPQFSSEAIKYKLSYKKEEAMSLATDKRANTLLSSILNVIDVIEDNDKVGVFYNFVPCTQASWRADYDRTIKKLNNNEPLEFNKFNVIYCVKLLSYLVIELSNMIIDTFSSLLGEDKKDSKEWLIKVPFIEDKPLLPETKKKRENQIIQTQVAIFSESKDKLRRSNNAYSVCESFKSITGDNDLIYKRCFDKNDFNKIINKQRIDGIDTLRMSPEELQQFISLPAKELLEQYRVIDAVNTIETEVPKELMTGYIRLGTNTYRGHQQEAYFRDTYDQGNLPVVCVGSQGSGKSTFIMNYVKDVQKRGECAIVIDYIKNCELSESIKNVVNKDNIIELDLSDYNNAQGIGYNELKPTDKRKLIEIANLKAIYISMLIDAVNVDGEPLSTPMDRYLNAASNIVMLKENASLRDVIKCLENWEVRHQFINAISKELKGILDDEICALCELDEKENKGDNKGEIIGTRLTKIDGIQHRINLLKKDLKLKMMFNKTTENNIDFVKAMDDGKVILIKMPQSDFPSPYARNVIVTYFFTKIWSSTLVRGDIYNKPKRVHLIVDELFQAPTAMRLLKDQEWLPQTRKFGLRSVFSCQYLGQMEIINQTLKSAGASYMLLKGSGSNTYNEFKDILPPYTIDDLEALPQYHSLNIISYEKGRAKFITKLPPLK